MPVAELHVLRCLGLSFPVSTKSRRLNRNVAHFGAWTVPGELHLVAPLSVAEHHDGVRVLPGEEVLDFGSYPLGG